MRKLLSIMLMVIVSLTFTFSFQVSANEGVKLSEDVIKLEDLITRKTLEGGVVLNKQIVKTLQYGDAEKGFWRDNTYQYITMPDVGNDTIKVVTWSRGTDDGWKSATVRTTVEDYETRNPGWKVVAAVNGDFFAINSTYEPTNNFVQNGDVLKRGSSSTTSIGIISDRSFIAGTPTSNNYLSLKIIEGDMTTTNIRMKSANALPGDDGIALITRDNTNLVNLTGYTVFVGDYELNRITSNTHFVKGTIKSVAKDIGNVKAVKDGQFYLVTKDPSYEEILTTGTYLKCEHELTGAFKDVKNTMGYNYKLVENGVALHRSVTVSDNSTVGTANPRTVMGWKKDGTLILMVIDGRQSAYQRHGVDLFEAAELLRIAGADEGYNLDGGGSSTLIIRNENDGFDVVNTPSDGSERSIGNAVLLVMQDPHLEVTSKTGKSLKFEQTAPIASGTIKDIRVRVGGKEYDFVDGSVNVTGLRPETVYDVTYFYTIEGEEGTINRTCTSMTYKVSTPAEGAEIRSFKKASTLNLGFKLSYEYRDAKDTVERAYIKYGDEVVQLTEMKDTVTITGLTKGEEYDFHLTLELKDGTKVIETLTLVAEAVATGGGGGCSFGAAYYLISVISILSLGLMVFRRRK